MDLDVVAQRYGMATFTNILYIRTKLPFALFGQINQPFALLPKLNREMPLF